MWRTIKLRERVRTIIRNVWVALSVCSCIVNDYCIRVMGAIVPNIMQSAWSIVVNDCAVVILGCI